MKENILNNFLEYVAIETTSDPSNASNKPSSNNQFKLLSILEQQLLNLNLEVTYDKENGYVYGLLKGTQKGPAVGFLAHVDTAPDYSAYKVAPKIITNYEGKSINLNKNTTLNPKIFPSLLDHVGDTLITTDGTTLLGADDKAGISEIINALKYIKENNIKHSNVYIAFTTDEEIGQGVVNFDTNIFSPDFAYTIDGGKLGELQYENFNAASCKISITGRNVHPGEAKDKMINSAELAINFHRNIPQKEKPEYTQNYEGFFFLTNMTTTVENTTLNYIIRDHDFQKFNQKKELLKENFQKYIKNEAVNASIEITDQYLNMYEKIKDKLYIIDIAKTAMENNNIKPLITPIRGGTDGSNLSFMGIPCPNIFTGGYNFHGKYEFISLEAMEKATLTIVEIIKICSNYPKK